MRMMAVTMALVMSGGCAMPSVGPLLEVARAAMVEEAHRLEADQARDAAWVNQSRATLHAAYDADLAAQQELSASWVREATQAYVLAREALTQHEAQLSAERQQRAANLAAAARAQSAAIRILEKQDALIDRLTGGELRTVLGQEAERWR